VANNNVAELTDLGKREFLVLSILAISVLIVGVWPAPLVDMMSASIDNLLLQISNTKIPEIG
jgi:NADH-quinone oxidoreductase subunit M